MIDVPVPTIEKPLTPIDYIAALYQCITASEVASFAEACPEAVRNDERFTKAVRAHLAAIRKAAA